MINSFSKSRSTILAFLVAYSSTAVVAAELDIITLGDSITAGLSRSSQFVITCPDGVSKEADRYNSSNSTLVCYGNGVINKGGYQTFLKTTLERDGHTPLISNFGFSGIRSDQMINELNSALVARPSATYILIMGGANDVSAGVSASTVVSNISFMVTDAINAGLTPVIATVIRDTRSAVFDARAAQYADAIRNYANSNGVLLADPRSSMGVNWGTYHSGDGLHLNETGNAQLSADFYNALNIPRVFVPMSAIRSLLLDDS